MRTPARVAESCSSGVLPSRWDNQVLGLSIGMFPLTLTVLDRDSISSLLRTVRIRGNIPNYQGL